GGVGGGDAGVGDDAGGPDGATGGHAEGRGRQSAGGAGGDLGEQHLGRGDRGRKRARDECRSRLGDDHGDERRPERHGADQRDGGTGRVGGGDAGGGGPATGRHGPADCDPKG